MTHDDQDRATRSRCGRCSTGCPTIARFADIQRAIAVLMWPKKDDGSLEPPKRLSPDEVKERLRAWLKSEGEK